MPINKKLNTVLKNAMDKITPVTRKDEIGTIQLSEEYPNEVEKSVANFRFIFHNDSTVRGLILNNTFTALNKFRIGIKKGYEDVKNINEARDYIEKRCEVSDWNLRKIIRQTLIKVQRDRQCFIQIPILGGQAHLNPLIYDGEDYDFMMVPDQGTGKIAGYVQKHPEIVNFSNWQNMSWDELEEASEGSDEFTTTSFLEDEMIHFTILDEDGRAVGLMDAVTDNIKDKWDYEGYMISVSQKTGAIAVVKIGDETTDAEKVDKSFVQSVLDIFEGRIKKTVATIPKGVSVDQMNNSTLPDIPSYRKTVIDEIYLSMQTPIGAFDTQSSNYASLKKAMDDETGFAVWMLLIRSLVKEGFETKLFDKDLSLQKEFIDCVGGIEMCFADDLDELEALEPTDEDYSDNNEGLEQAANNQNENNDGDNGDGEED